jgi:putative chitinase
MTTVNLTAAALVRFAPGARPDIVAALIAGGDLLARSAIVPPLRLPHFMAQIAHETGGFTIYTESGAYTADNLAAMWDGGNWHRYFADRDACIAMAERCRVDHGEALFNLVYSNRMGNGPPESGDGWRYRGRGLIQTTGREGYRRVGHEDNPEALTDPAIGLVAAIDEFVRSGCLELADVDDLVGVRRRINGGTVGLDQVRVWLAHAKALFGSAELVTGSPPATPTLADLWKRNQSALKARGFYDAEVDGDPGRKTAGAVAALLADTGPSV